MQANKRHKLMQGPIEETNSGNDDAASDASESDASEEEEEQHHQQAAGFSLDLGAATVGDSKFRDENFYLGYDRGDNRYAEEGFAVGGRGEDMVLDLAGDENVSRASKSMLCWCQVLQPHDDVLYCMLHCSANMAFLLHRIVCPRSLYTCRPSVS